MPTALLKIRRERLCPGDDDVGPDYAAIWLGPRTIVGDGDALRTMRSGEPSSCPAREAR